MSEFFTMPHLVAFLTLLALEIVLGIDNVIFIAILSGKLPKEQQALGRRLGIGLAVFSRVVLLLAINWVIGLTAPLVEIFGNSISGRDLILLVGGMFLIGKSTYEIHEKLDVEDHIDGKTKLKKVTLTSVLIQIILIDVVFSLDSVITAVGISGELPIMIPAIVIAAAIMLFASGAISRFVDENPTMKMLALSFLILIGALLVIEGWNPTAAHEMHLKNYGYFAMAFSFTVEILNMRLRRTQKAPVSLHNQPKLPHSGD